MRGLFPKETEEKYGIQKMNRDNTEEEVMK